MDNSTEEPDDLVTKLPTVMPNTIDMVTMRLKPGDDYYSDKRDYMAKKNDFLYKYIDDYSRKTPYPDETIRTALLTYSLLEEEAGKEEGGKVPVITKKATGKVEEEKLFQTNQEFVSPILHRMVSDNPYYYKALESYIKTSKDLGTNWATAAFMYRIFEKQAELNKLKIN